jgi:hypothetical protein
MEREKMTPKNNKHMRLTWNKIWVILIKWKNLNQLKV